MKVYVVEYCWDVYEDQWAPIGLRGTLAKARLVMRAKSPFYAKLRVRPYLRVEPASRKKARSGKGKRRG